jgi:hypothetical protein
MPRSIDAERATAEAREALAAGAFDRASEAAWRAASAAAQIGDEQMLEEVLAIAGRLGDHGAEDARQLQIYTEASLEDARAGTRPLSMFERLLPRGRQKPKS